MPNNYTVEQLWVLSERSDSRGKDDPLLEFVSYFKLSHDQSRLTHRPGLGFLRSFFFLLWTPF